MTIHHLRKVLYHLQRALDPSGASSLTDGQLLARFVATREEAAFASLMRRHGPMVLGVCRRILRHTQDAEDAFQAVFLVLARKAETVAHRPALGSWLYRVAYRIALDAKARNGKRHTREKQVDELPHPSVAPAEICDWRTWFDRELNRLPERYRAVLVACDLEERPRKEAARLLGLTEGTVSSRLARGRRLLAKRLSRYGLSLSAVMGTAAWLPEAPAAVPLALTSATLLAVSGRGAISASVGFLTKGAVNAMFLTKLKWTVGVVMVVTALGATGLAYRASGQVSSGQSTAAPAEKAAGGKPATELDILRREIELLKLKVEVLQEKQRAQESELRALRAAAGGKWDRGGYASGTPQPQADAKAQPDFRIFRNDGTLRWPPVFQNARFNYHRELLDALMKDAYLAVLSGDFRDDMVNDLLAGVRKFQEALDANVGLLSSDQYIEGKRYLRMVKDTITAMMDPSAVKLWKERVNPDSDKQWKELATRAKAHIQGQDNRTAASEGKNQQPPASMRTDGTIIRMQAQGGMAYINLGSADNIEPNVTFTIHAVGSDGRPNPQSKGTLEVVSVIGPHLSQARITSVKDPGNNPIRERDILYNENRNSSLKSRNKAVRVDAQLLKEVEELIRLQEVEAALKALREARDPKEKQRAAHELESVLKNLREEMNKQESGPQGQR